TPGRGGSTEQTAHSGASPAKPAKPVALSLYVANGPNGPCMALGPASPAPNATISNWLGTVHYPPCTVSRPLPTLNPVAFAVTFWRTIPLPVPRPRIPPGYAVTGKPAYLVTNGTTDPPAFTRTTPLGLLTVRATGSYVVDWGDGTIPAW